LQDGHFKNNKHFISSVTFETKVRAYQSWSLLAFHIYIYVTIYIP
jgi:hypothetical protein